MIKISRLLLLSAFLFAGALFGQDAQVTPLMSKDLPDFPGKEALMITVVYPPGASDPIHRHNAHAFVYVLEGSIVMQVKGGKEATLTPGQTLYEGPKLVVANSGAFPSRRRVGIWIYRSKNIFRLAGSCRRHSYLLRLGDRLSTA